MGSVYDGLEEVENGFIIHTYVVNDYWRGSAGVLMMRTFHEFSAAKAYAIDLAKERYDCFTPEQAIQHGYIRIYETFHDKAPKRIKL